jgi:hypothetical protein
MQAMLELQLSQVVVALSRRFQLIACDGHSSAQSHPPNRLQPLPYLPRRIALIEQLHSHPLDGLPVEPPIRRLAAPFPGPPRQQFSQITDGDKT